MPVANPTYNPDWKDVYDYHQAELEKLDQVIGEYYRTSFVGPEFAEALRARDNHQSSVNETYIMKQPTVQSYAQWLFENFPVRSSLASIPVQVPDIEKFTSIDEVRDARKKIKDDVDQSVAEMRYALPTGQPEGMNAFQIESKEQIFSQWRYFSEKEIYPNGWGSGSGMSTLMTMHQVGDQMHVCFMHDARHPGLSVVNGIERLANVVYREALQNQAAQTDRTAISLMDDFIKAPESKQPLLPKDCYFYIHIPPRDAGFQKEAFIKVEMEFGPNGFHSSEWNHQSVIPELIQNARFEHTKEAVAQPITTAHLLDKTI